MLLPYDPSRHTELIAALHFKALGWTANSRLGESHIRKIYRGLAELPSTFGFVWMEDRQLVGYALGSMNSAEARRKIQSVYTMWDVLRIMIGSLTNPLNFVYAFESVFVIPRYLKKCGTAVEWIAWNADKSHPKYRTASIQCYYALRKYYAANGETMFIAQGERRSRESEAVLYADPNITKKVFFQNIIYLITVKGRST